MSVSEEHLRQSVDEALEPVWPAERRRAARWWLCSTLARAALGVLAFWGLALALDLLFGLALPWTFYACIGGLTILAALREARDPEHLRRDEPA
jgi:Mn2+/Fe2+ NRAMP family transporter